MQWVIEKAQVTTQEQNVFKFMTGSPSLPQVQSKLRSVVPPGPLRNCPWNIDCSTPEVQDQSEILRGWQILRHCVDPEHEMMSPFPDFELMKVLQ
jgi:hypothetical protein